jgi:hypothetical protein
MFVDWDRAIVNYEGFSGDSLDLVFGAASL